MNALYDIFWYLSAGGVAGFAVAGTVLHHVACQALEQDRPDAAARFTHAVVAWLLSLVCALHLVLLGTP